MDPAGSRKQDSPGLVGCLRDWSRSEVSGVEVPGCSLRLGHFAKTNWAVSAWCVAVPKAAVLLSDRNPNLVSYENTSGRTRVILSGDGLRA